jgi:hypothetical protein
MKTNLHTVARLFLAVVLVAGSSVTGLAAEPIEATTPDGRRVILHSDGRWEFGAEPTEGARTSGAVAPKAAATTAAGTAASGGPARPDDRYCQGGLFGVGRRICPGDPDYNRGSLNPKLH